MAEIEYNLTEAEQTYSNVKEMLKKKWKNIAINIFEWKGLEDICEGLTSEILEETLYEKGEALFFKDDNLGFMALPVAPANKLNVYFRPTKFRAYGMNYNKEYSVDNSVLIRNNALREPTANYIDYYCSKLADIEMTLDLRRGAHKTPLILESDADTILSQKNTYKKIRANEPVIYTNKNKQNFEKGINAFDTRVEYINDKLHDEYNTYEARILNILGLDNYVEDKAERVQSAEVEAQQEYIISSFRVSLEARKKACEKINKMFGLNLSVDYVKGEQIETDEREVEENGEIYSGTENDNK